MAAPKGNRFWEARSSHGTNPSFKDPDQLWNACVEYFQWTESNPLKAEKLFSHNGVVIRGEYNKIRAMTIEGLCNFLGITSRTWRYYREKDDFFPITERVEQILFEQKFTGAAADLLNANIIARDLGLADKAEVGGPDGAPVQVKVTHDPMELARAVAFALAKAAHEKGSSEPST
jgi:hypothetical protein